MNTKQMFAADMATAMIHDFNDTNNPELQAEVTKAIQNVNQGGTPVDAEISLKILFANDVINFAKGQKKGLLFPHTESLMIAELQVYGDDLEAWNESGLGFLSAVTGSVLGAGISALGGYMTAKVMAEAQVEIAEIQSRTAIKLAEYETKVKLAEVDALIQQAQIALETTKVALGIKKEIVQMGWGGTTNIIAILTGAGVLSFGMYLLLGKRK